MYVKTETTLTSLRAYAVMRKPSLCTCSFLIHVNALTRLHGSTCWSEPSLRLALLLHLHTHDLFLPFPSNGSKLIGDRILFFCSTPPVSRSARARFSTRWTPRTRSVPSTYFLGIIMSHSYKCIFIVICFPFYNCMSIIVNFVQKKAISVFCPSLCPSIWRLLVDIRIISL